MTDNPIDYITGGIAAFGMLTAFFPFHMAGFVSIVGYIGYSIGRSKGR